MQNDHFMDSSESSDSQKGFKYMVLWDQEYLVWAKDARSGTAMASILVFFDWRLTK